MTGVFAEILAAFLGLLESVVQIYSFVILFAVVISWVGADPYNPIVRFVQQITDPLLGPIRRRMWRLTRQLGLDFSPLVAMFMLIALEIVLQRLKLAVLTGF